jgi:hypothetical protein
VQIPQKSRRHIKLRSLQMVLEERTLDLIYKSLLYVVPSANASAMPFGSASRAPTKSDSPTSFERDRQTPACEFGPLRAAHRFGRIGYILAAKRTTTFKPRPRPFSITPWQSPWQSSDRPPRSDGPLRIPIRPFRAPQAPQRAAPTCHGESVRFAGTQKESEIAYRVEKETQISGAHPPPKPLS